MNGIAIYIRLSKADEETGRGKDESNSVVNQRSLIHSFLDNREEFSGLARKEFIDDGYSGTRTDRPKYMEMMKEIKEGRFSICISKDFSRMFRDYVEMGECLEKTFPSLHVRYISINDHYDGNDYKGTTGGMDVVVKNIINSFYSRDMSAKEVSGKRQSAIKGRRASGNPAYGYMIDPNRKAMDIIDPEAARVVRRIFDDALAGSKPTEIARRLNREGIDPPGLYFRKQHPQDKRFASTERHPLWNTNGVRTILERYTYTGASVNGKKRIVFPCKNAFSYHNLDECIIVKGMHEAIISEEEYDKVQKMIHNNKKYIRQNEAFPLKSLVFCGCCGKAMPRLNPKTKVFRCYNHRDVDFSSCKNVVSPKEETLETIVYDAINCYIKVSGLKIEKLKKKTKQYRDDLESTQDRVRKLNQEIETIKEEKLSLYERFASGEISKNTYTKEKKTFDAKLALCESEIKEKKLSIKVSASDDDSVCSEAEAACRVYEGEDHLTYEMAHAFVDKIIVYAKDRIEIKWRFKDLFADKIREMQEQGLVNN